MYKLNLFFFFIVAHVPISPAQDFRWQQRVEYVMDVKLDVNTHKLTGTQ